MSASGEVVLVQWITLFYPGGTLDLDIKVAVGDLVSQNDLLVSVNDPRLLANLFQAQTLHKRAQLAYDLAVNAPSAAELAAAKSALANAEANFERQENLRASDTVINAAEADVEAAQAALEALQEGASSEEITAA